MSLVLLICTIADASSLFSVAVALCTEDDLITTRLLCFVLILLEF